MSPEELKFWEEVNSLVVPVKFAKVEYRLHYNNLGEIVDRSMTDHPESQQYIVVSKEEYELYFNYKVANGKLTKIENDSGYCVQLKQSTKGHRVVKGHANLVLEDGEVYNDIEFYDYRNN